MNESNPVSPELERIADKTRDLVRAHFDKRYRGENRSEDKIYEIILSVLKEQHDQVQLLTVCRDHWKTSFEHDRKNTIKMYLCEASRLCLKPGQSYRFKLDPDCPKCRDLSALALQVEKEKERDLANAATPLPQTNESNEGTSGHTPGPWRVIRFSDRVRLAVANEELEIICEVNAVQEGHKANAALLANAPQNQQLLKNAATVLRASRYAIRHPDRNHEGFLATLEGLLAAIERRVPSLQPTSHE